MKKIRNRITKYPEYYIIYVSNEELEKIIDFKNKNGHARSKIIRDHLLIGGLMEDDKNIIKNISIARKSKDWKYKNAIGFSYTKKMEEKLKELEEKTGAYKTSLIRTFLQQSKLI